MDTVTICNLSLMLVGIPAITGFFEENTNAKLCRTYYGVVRDRVLRDHTWSFATKVDELAQVEEGKEGIYPFICALPGDVIRVIRMESNMPYLRIGNRVHVRALPERVIYTARIEDPNLFDETFIEAFQYLLAAEIGLSNTRNLQMTDYFRKEYEKRLAVARAIDSQENRFLYQVQPRRSRWRSGGSTDSEREFSGSVKWVQGTEGKQGD